MEKHSYLDRSSKCFGENFPNSTWELLLTNPNYNNSFTGRGTATTTTMAAAIYWRIDQYYITLQNDPLPLLPFISYFFAYVPTFSKRRP